MCLSVCCITPYLVFFLFLSSSFPFSSFLLLLLSFPSSSPLRVSTLQFSFFTVRASTRPLQIDGFTCFLFLAVVLLCTFFFSYAFFFLTLCPVLRAFSGFPFYRFHCLAHYSVQTTKHNCPEHPTYRDSPVVPRHSLP